MTPLAALASDLLDLFAPRTCSACDAPHPTFPSREGPSLCATCAVMIEPAVDPPDGVTVPYAHGGALLDAIHRAKYGDSPRVARQLGALLQRPLANDLEWCEFIVPVPLHPRRLANRTFNQALEIARSLGRPIRARDIVRTRDTPAQVGLAREARVRNVRGAFAPARRHALAGRRVLVLDDVVTTGATLAEVAGAVRSAGAVAVRLAALVRAPLDPL